MLRISGLRISYYPSMNLINVLIFLFVALSYTTANVVHKERNEPTGIISSNIQPLTYVREKRTPPSGFKGVQLPGHNLNHPIPASILTAFKEAVQRRIIERNDQNGGNGNRDPNIAGPSHGRSAQRVPNSQDDGVSHALCMLHLGIRVLLRRQQDPVVFSNPQLLTPGNLRRIMNAILQIECSQNTLSPSQFENALWALGNDLGLGNSQQPPFNPNDFLGRPIFNLDQCRQGSSSSSTSFANMQLPPPANTAVCHVCNSCGSVAPSTADHSTFPLDLSTRHDYNNPQAAQPSVIRPSVIRRTNDNNQLPQASHQSPSHQNQIANNNGQPKPAGSSAKRSSRIPKRYYIKSLSQIEFLNKEYNQDPQTPPLHSQRLERIAKDSGVPEYAVYQWFATKNNKSKQKP